MIDLQPVRHSRHGPRELDRLPGRLVDRPGWRQPEQRPGGMRIEHRVPGREQPAEPGNDRADAGDPRDCHRWQRHSRNADRQRHMGEVLDRLAPHRRQAPEALHEPRAGRIELVDHAPVPPGVRPRSGCRHGDELDHPRGQRPGPPQPTALGDLEHDIVGPLARREGHVNGDRLETLRGARRAFLPGDRCQLVEEPGAAVGLTAVGGVADPNP